jgi:hypothetical protein
MNRYTIVLNGWEAIHEAFIKNGLAFADREQFAIGKKIFGNPNSKGTERLCTRTMELNVNIDYARNPSFNAKVM